jgi:hypothetical protein
MGFVVKKVVIGTGYFPSTLNFACQCHSTTAPYPIIRLQLCNSGNWHIVVKQHEETWPNKTVAMKTPVFSESAAMSTERGNITSSYIVSRLTVWRHKPVWCPHQWLAVNKTCGWISQTRTPVFLVRFLHGLVPNRRDRRFFSSYIHN